MKTLVYRSTIYDRVEEKYVQITLYRDEYGDYSTDVSQFF